MEHLPTDVIRNITEYLQLHDYINLGLCSKTLYTQVSSLYEKLPSNINIRNKNIFELFKLLRLYHDDILKNKNSYSDEIRYDIEWAIAKFHSERQKISKGLTHEQREIIKYNGNPGDVILIQAFAGTGKTTTLINVAKQNQDKNILYLTFNKSLADNANSISHIDHVKICTMHSLALSVVDPNKEFQIGKISLKYIEEVFNIDRIESTIIRNILNNFFASNSRYISTCHTCTMNISNEEYFIEIANDLWASMKNKTCKMPHDGYLKLYQLLNQKLDYDIIMLDEAQDSTECMLQIIKKQKHSIKYLVGDCHQQIYGFRNVCNIFENAYSNVINFSLSQSFRYGYQIAHIANMFLNRFKNESKKIYSYGLNTNILTNVSRLNGEPYTIISRTNNALLKEAFDLNSDLKVHILGKEYNFNKECLYAEAFQSIIDGIIPNNEKVHFISIEEMQKHYQNLSNYKWLSRINIFLEYGIEIIDKYRQLQNQLTTLEDADVILTTAHQAKGLEFNNIKLCNDFIPLITSLNTIYTYKSKSAIEAYNIFYVAFTRGKKNIVLNKELYNFLNILKGQRTFNFELNSYIEDGITCIGFDSKPIYTKI